MDAAAFLTRSQTEKHVCSLARPGQRRAILVAADRAGKPPPTSSSLADEKRVGSLLLSTAARDPGWTHCWPVKDLPLA